jgi:hypothetical protein
MHDSEKVGERVKANLELTEKNIAACVHHLGAEAEGAKCLKRMIKHFTHEKNIAEKTIEALKVLKK